MNYYDTHAQQYFDKTAHADMKELYDMVLPDLPKSARILDLGCGSGRDAAFFKAQGYDVLQSSFRGDWRVLLWKISHRSLPI